MTEAKKAILLINRQIVDLLSKIEPHNYKKPISAFDGHSLGQHFRHTLEFFQCLEQGINEGMVDYASRTRNLLYEENPVLASNAFKDFAVRLQGIVQDKTLLVQAEYGGTDRPQYSSSLGRELLFVYDHAIHHLAIIKIGLRSDFQHIQFEEDLGVSPATLMARGVHAD